MFSETFDAFYWRNGAKQKFIFNFQKELQW